MIKKASKNMKGFDTCTPLSLEKAREFKNAGYDFCIRYVSLSNNRAGDITTKEANDIINAGLALGIVQHVRYPGWKPSASLGQNDAQMALNHLIQVGIQKGITVYVDLEGVASGTPTSDIIAYANTWHDVVAQAGYIPGIYIGANSFLTSSQLYNSLKFQHYWKSLSIVPDVAVRGYEMVQLRQINQLGVLIDEDVVYGDNLGNTPIFIFPNMQEDEVSIAPFNDVTQNHWAYQAIKAVYDRGLLSNSTSFRPDDEMTRAEAVVMLNRIIHYIKGNVQVPQKQVTYKDIVPGYWAYNDIVEVFKLGLLSPEITFRPADSITRAEFSALLERLLEFLGIKLNPVTIPFADMQGHWAFEVVSKLYSIKLISTDTLFRPNDPITRAEAIALFDRTLKYLGK